MSTCGIREKIIGHTAVCNGYACVLNLVNSRAFMLVRGLGVLVNLYLCRGLNVSIDIVRLRGSTQEIAGTG